MHEKATRARRAPPDDSPSANFFTHFKAGFRDKIYFGWERGYKERAHQQWLDVLDREKFLKTLLTRPAEVAAHAVHIESRTNLLFSFEKMALRDAVKSPTGGCKLIRACALRIFRMAAGATRLVSKIGAMPSAACRDARHACSTWPLVIVWGLIVQPERHIFLKPNVTRSRG